MSERRWEVMELKNGSMIVVTTLDPEAREALDALMEEDHWTDVSDAVSGALVALVEVRLAESATFSEKMAARSLRAAPRDTLDGEVRDILLEYAEGRKEWSQTYAELVEYPFTFSADAEPGNPLSVRTWGSWDEVRAAHSGGWISTAQYWQLSSRILGQGPGVVL